MKKSIYIVVLLAIISFSLTACTKKISTPGSDTENSEQSMGEEETYNASILDLIKLGKNMKCTYELDVENESRKIVSYVSDGKTRSYVSVKTPDGKEVTTNTLMDGDLMYMWTSETNQGMVVDMKEFDNSDEVDAPDTTDSYQYSDQNQKIDYKCGPWVPSQSEFQLPSNIEFMDLSKMMEGYNIPGLE
ncbi:hypothetical protein K0B04_03345 [Patescibacteria group bacterium]|nr:hypothetical protein [Patescibacteria group bacterium]